MAVYSYGAQRTINENDPTKGINTYEFYDRNLLENAREEFIISNFTSKKSMPKYEGDGVVFSYYEHLDTFETPLTEGQTPTSSVLEKVNVRGKMNQYGSFVPYTDIVNIHGEDGARFISDVTQNLGGAAGQTQEKIIIDTIIGEATQIVFDTDLATTFKTAELSLRNSLAAKFKTMITGSVNYGTTPVRPAYVGIVSPDGAAALESTPGYKGVEEYGYSDGLLPNEVGSYRGIRFCETTLMPNDTTGGTPGKLQAIILAEEAVAEVGIRGMKKIQTIIKELGSAKADDYLNQNGSVGCKFHLAAVTLRPDWCAVVAMEA
jgi:N4-gp56 family major capsid protein